MNKDRLLELADIIEAAPKKRFGMMNFTADADGEAVAIRPKEWNTCSTAGCIAGWAVGLYGDKRRKVEAEEVEEYAQELLGLTEDEARNLFFGPTIRRAVGAPMNLSEMTQADAVAGIRWLVSTS